MKKSIFFLCLVAFAAAVGPSCTTDGDCVDSIDEELEVDTLYCQELQAFAAPSSLAPNAAIAEGALWAEVTADAGSAPSGFNSTTGTYDNPGSNPVCARSPNPAFAATSWTAVPSKPRSAVCVQCTADWHCGAGEFCVGPSGTFQSRPGFAGNYPNDPVAQSEADPFGGFCDAIVPAAYRAEMCPSFDVTLFGFTHPEYEQTYEPYTCAPIGFPVGEKCSSSVTISNYDEGVNSDLFCGLVTEVWDPVCRDGLAFGEPDLLPQSGAKIVQWAGACIDSKCYECRVGDTRGPGGVADDSKEYQCIGSGLNGAGGHWVRNSRSEANDYNSVPRDLLLQAVLFLCLIALCAFVYIGSQAAFACLKPCCQKVCCCASCKAEKQEDAEAAYITPAKPKKAKDSDMFSEDDTEETEETATEDTTMTDDTDAETLETTLESST